MRLQWNDALDTGIQEIDAQHRELYRRIDQLLEAAARGEGRQTVAETIEFLQRYAVTHFRAEEKRMLAGSYPEYEAHRQLHAGFEADLAALKTQYERDGATSLLVIQVQRRVIDWLNSHIAVQDQKFSRFVHA